MCYTHTFVFYLKCACPHVEVYFLSKNATFYQCTRIMNGVLRGFFPTLVIRQAIHMWGWGWDLLITGCMGNSIVLGAAF
jgi:hypothetical protein